MVRFLVNSRAGSHWETTKDSAAAIRALTLHLRKNRELSSEYSLRVSLNGATTCEKKVTRENILCFPGMVALPPQHFRQGENRVAITREKEGGPSTIRAGSAT
jgi:hypothetical protein